MVKSYRDLMVWQKAMELAEESYSLTKRLPKEEIFGLSNQIRRAAVSIPSNIAEGHGRSSTRDYVHFLSIARGSKCELETQLLLCIRIGYISEARAKTAMRLCDGISKMLNALIRKLTLIPNP